MYQDNHLNMLQLKKAVKNIKDKNKSNHLDNPRQYAPPTPKNNSPMPCGGYTQKSPSCVPPRSIDGLLLTCTVDDTVLRTANLCLVHQMSHNLPYP